MLYTYPALFYFDDTETEEVPYFVHFPDLENSATQGNNISDAIRMAVDLLGNLLTYYVEDGKHVPRTSNINDLSLVGNNPFKDDDFDFKFQVDKSFISMVTVDLDDFLDYNDPIELTLAIPKWADESGKRLHLHYSKALTDAIMQKTDEAY